MPLFSIVIAVYNNEKYVGAAVESIETQGFDDYEIIIVDDGSTDRTPEIVDSLAEKNSRITVIHQENRWIYASFNRGIEQACGDYIYILNSDDRFAQGALTVMADLVIKYNRPDVIWTKVSLCGCDLDMNIISKYDMNSKVIKEEYYCKTDRPFEEILIADRMELMANQANLYKASIAKQVPFRNDVYGADRLYNLAIAKYVNSFVVCDKEIYLFYNYSWGKGNASIGKYYGYEQYMFNEFYINYRKMLSEMSILSDENMVIERLRRKRNFTSQMSFLLNVCNDKSIDEKLKIIFNENIDDIIVECTRDSDGEELEARVLSILRKYFINHCPPRKESEMYFVYEMLESLLRYEIDNDDLERIRRGVYNVHNPHHVGIKFFNQLLSNSEEK